MTFYGEHFFRFIFIYLFTCIFFNDSVSIADSRASNDRIIIVLVLLRNFPGGTEENYEKPKSV
jgi:hypothetical protein